MGRTQHGVIGTLARTPLGGSGEQTLAMDVAAADWFPDGGLAVVRVENGQSRIEHPIQNVLYTSTGYIDALRVSPAGDAIAFLDHPLPDDSAGSVAIVDLAGHARTISPRYNSMRGLAWSRDGREVWFAAAERGTNMGVWAASLRAGRSPQLIRTFSDYVSVEDLSENGRALLSLHALSESMIHVGPAGESKDLYWHDQSQVRDISVDGRILFSESGDATQRDYEAYVRNASGAPDPLRLGVGLPLSLSPDGQWVIANPASSPAPLTLLPTGAGEKKSLAADDIDHIGAAWLPGGKSFVFAGAPRGEKLRYYVQSLDGGAPRPITGADIHYERRSPIVVSPGGESVAAVRNDGSVLIYPAEGGEPQAVPGLTPGSGFTPLQWCGDGRLVLHQYDGPTPVLWKVDIKTGEREPWKELSPPNLVGLLDITPIRVSPDCRSYAYSPLNVLSQVSLATGLR
jgi:Tol biopolymer transport system component